MDRRDVSIAGIVARLRVVEDADGSDLRAAAVSADLNNLVAIGMSPKAFMVSPFDS
jgi:hypothetical protein